MNSVRFGRNLWDQETFAMFFSRRFSPTAVVCMLGLRALGVPAKAIDPNHLPADTEAVAVINFRQILGSDLVKTNKDLIGQLQVMVEGKLAEEGIQKYLKKIDFDLFRDLDRITVATAGSKTPDFIVLEGKFDADKILATGTEASKDNVDYIKPIKIAGQPAFEIVPAPNEKAIFAGMIGKDKLIATSSKEGFAAAVARFGSSQPSKLKKELQSVMEAGGKQSLSLVTTGPALAKMLEDAPVPNVEALQSVLDNVTALNIAITIEKNVNFELAVNSKDKQSAEQMVKLTSIGLAASRMMLKKRAETDAKYAPALDIVNTMRVTSKDNNFVLRGQITAEALSRILKDLPKDLPK